MRFKKLMAAVLTSGMILSFVPATAMADSTGWRSDEWGWKYYTSDSEYYIDTWKEIDGNWYYFYEDGYVLVDTFAWIDGDMYHFDAKGRMDKNKWIPCRYFITGYNDDGHPIYDKSRSQWRYVGANGKVYSGWKKINGSWYFFGDEKTGSVYNDYGIMATGQPYFVDNGKQERLEYYFADNGKMVTNSWVQNQYGSWGFYGSDGRAYKGWHKISNKWYFFDYSYEMKTGILFDWENDGSVWFLDPSGALNTTPGWHKDPSTGFYCYLKSGGKGYQSEWLKVGKKWYYFDRFGQMVSGCKNVLINDKLYDFDSNGVCSNPDSGRPVKGWQQISVLYMDGPATSLAYADSKGELYRDKWLTQGSSTYYFDEQGHMVFDYDGFTLDGKLYKVDASGRVTQYGKDKAGWVELDYGWAYIGSDGKYYTGWKKINGNWYYFDEWSGITFPNSFWSMYDDPNIQYFFDEDCKMVTGWFQYWDEWFYAKPDGRVAEGEWLKYRGSWYYFTDGYPSMSTAYNYVINGRGYNFDENGKCLNPDDPCVAIVDDTVYE